MAIIQVEIDCDGEYCGKCTFAFPYKRNPKEFYICENKAFTTAYGIPLDKQTPGIPKRTKQCLESEVKHD